MKFNRYLTERTQRYAVLIRLTKGEYRMLAIKAALYFRGKNSVSKLIRESVKTYQPKIEAPICFSCKTTMENTLITKSDLIDGVTIKDYPAWHCPSCDMTTTNLHLGTAIEKHLTKNEFSGEISFQDLLK